MATDAHWDQSLRRLPLPYATAPRSRGAGTTDEVIAECVGVDIAARPTFMRVAEAKLASASKEPHTWAGAGIPRLLESGERPSPLARICQ